ncbi:MAG: bifunctional phosphoribosylaminoimidazolecarboxamide formyltransferase/IMP cyclohydrolase, partial [Patescibacteria group bacterium]
MKYALISVYDKENIVEFAKNLENLGYGIISTSKTANLLKENNINVKEISEITNFPEILNGRVKTLHPLIFGSLLADRENENHKKEIEKFKLKNIEIVVVNLYPFEKIISGKHKIDEAIENIDIGGVSLIRASAKNYKNIITVTDKNDYEEVIEKIKNNENTIDFRRNLAIKAFAYVANYDIAIYNYFS